MHADAAKLTREREGSWVEDANGPESGNGGRDGLGRARSVVSRWVFLGVGDMVIVTIGFFCWSYIRVVLKRTRSARLPV